jgi:hypothetical protein
MKKLKLELERVQVQSFPTTPESEAMHGTVFGAGITNTLCGQTCRGPSCCHTEWEARAEP